MHCRSKFQLELINQAEMLRQNIPMGVVEALMATNTVLIQVTNRVTVVILKKGRI